MDSDVYGMVTDFKYVQLAKKNETVY